jgi:hypothetical protein
MIAGYIAFVTAMGLGFPLWIASILRSFFSLYGKLFLSIVACGLLLVALGSSSLRDMVLNSNDLARQALLEAESIQCPRSWREGEEDDGDIDDESVSGRVSQLIKFYCRRIVPATFVLLDLLDMIAIHNSRLSKIAAHFLGFDDVELGHFSDARAVATTLGERARRGTSVAIHTMIDGVDKTIDVSLYLASCLLHGNCSRGA